MPRAWRVSRSPPWIMYGRCPRCKRRPTRAIAAAQIIASHSVPFVTPCRSHPAFLISIPGPQYPRFLPCHGLADPAIEHVGHELQFAPRHTNTEAPMINLSAIREATSAEMPVIDLSRFDEESEADLRRF